MTKDFLTPFHELMNYTDDLQHCADDVLDFVDHFKEGRYDLERLVSIAADIKKNADRITDFNHKNLNTQNLNIKDIN
jgi:uncharacterized protein Yka (UPF0111/DUF47 family)